MTRRYFDWAASALPDTPLLSESLSLSLQLFANPSSVHADGRSARAALENARARCAAALSVPPDRLYFSSGGTESNNLALQSLLFSASSAAPRGLLISAVEHPSVSECASRLKRRGIPLAVCRPGSDGRIGGDALASALEDCPDAAIVAVMAANNETGAVNDIRSLVETVRDAERKNKKKYRFHCDAVQAAGKLPLDPAAWGVDSASVSAHKLGGPRGIGLLYSAGKFESPAAGGGQESGMRAGTENLFGAIALAGVLEKSAGAEALARNLSAATGRWSRLISAFRSLDRVRIVPECRTEEDARYSPYILQLACAGVPGEVMVRALDDAGISASTGSACSSGTGKRPVLEAMGVKPQTAFEAFRLSQGPATTDDDIGALLDAIKSCLRSLR